MACLCDAAGEAKVAGGALVDVPGREQAERAVAGRRAQEEAQVGDLVHQVGVRQHHALRRAHARWSHWWCHDKRDLDRRP